MSDRSKWIAVVVVGIMMLIACGGKQEVTFEDFVIQALRSYYIDNDYNSYMKCVDYGMELDSVQQKVVEAMYRQFTDKVKRQHGGVLEVNVESVETLDDGVTSFVHYQITYADSTRESSMLKVISDGEGWRIKSRN
ncbi:MAG: hypothetical protein J6Y41_00095 [Bacteroidaceae bacterium]|nr:hypothetical protein [Bacteroidaceae bacterium]